MEMTSMVLEHLPMEKVVRTGEFDTKSIQVLEHLEVGGVWQISHRQNLVEMVIILPLGMLVEEN